MIDYLHISNPYSVRVSNELGAGNPKSAAFSVVVVTVMSFIISVIAAIIILCLRDYISYAFTEGEVVARAVSDLCPLLATTLILNGIQPTEYVVGPEGSTLTGDTFMGRGFLPGTAHSGSGSGGADLDDLSEADVWSACHGDNDQDRNQGRRRSGEEELPSSEPIYGGNSKSIRSISSSFGSSQLRSRRRRRMGMRGAI
ncbi:hypothetical protein GW17_00036395 [Ensete ventricosum]|nr:hypothetical protein GW17_00036395 [Ensete ventricosum]